MIRMNELLTGLLIIEYLIHSISTSSSSSLSKDHNSTSTGSLTSFTFKSISPKVLSSSPSSSSSSWSSSSSSVYTETLISTFKSMRKGTQIYTNIDEFAARSRTESPSNLPKKSETELNSTKSMLSPTESYSRTVLGTFSSISTFLSSNSSSDTIESSKNRKLLSNTSFLLDTLLSEDKYDRKIRPNFGGRPTMIYTDIEIRSFGPISENDMMYSMDCYFRQTWWDERLKFGEIQSKDESGFLVLSMDWKFLQKVWIPDTYFYNGRSSYMHKTTTPNKFVRIRQDGQMRLTVKATCPMHLRKYPLDVQSCPLEIGSFAYTSKDVVYLWKGSNPVVIDDDVVLSQYEFINITTANITKKEQQKAVSYRSSIMVRFLLRRRRGYFILQIYAPCALIVGASWVSFWINKNDAAGRVSVGATTVLTLVTMGFGGKTTLPRVTYATALDWFVVMCFTFVFTAMVEYACVNFVDTKQAAKIKRILEMKLANKEIFNRKTNEEKRKVCILKDEENRELCENMIESDLKNEDQNEDENLYDTIESIDYKEDCCELANYSELKVKPEDVQDIENELKNTNLIIRITRKFTRNKKSLTNKWNEMPIEYLIEEEPSGGAILDGYARVGFPLAFAILNIIYWILYLYTIDDEIPINFENYTFM